MLGCNKPFSFQNHGIVKTIVFFQDSTWDLLPSFFFLGKQIYCTNILLVIKFLRRKYTNSTKRVSVVYWCIVPGPGGVLIWNHLRISRVLLCLCLTLQRQHSQRNLPQIIKLSDTKGKYLRCSFALIQLISTRCMGP